MEFEIQEEHIKKMAKAFKQKKATVSTLNKHYENVFKSKLSFEYLAHLVSVLEKIAREKTGNKLFVITLEPTDKKFPVGSAKYSPKRCFTVYYPEYADNLQKRVDIAHELGHLYILLLLEKTDITANTEAVCSIFAILAMADKCNFYKTKSQEYVPTTIYDIIAKMTLLHNRKKGKMNIS